MIGLLTLYLRLPGCASLKEKRGRLKPLLHRLHREFNISVAEIDLQDKWTETVIACGMVNREAAHLQRSLQTIRGWVERNWPDVQVFDDSIELL